MKRAGSGTVNQGTDPRIRILSKCHGSGTLIRIQVLSRNGEFRWYHNNSYSNLDARAQARANKRWIRIRNHWNFCTSSFLFSYRYRSKSIVFFLGGGGGLKIRKNHIENGTRGVWRSGPPGQGVAARAPRPEGWGPAASPPVPSASPVTAAGFTGQVVTGFRHSHQDLWGVGKLKIKNIILMIN